MRRGLQFGLFLGLALSCTASVAETGVNTVVNLIESRYSVRHRGVPLLWITKPFLLGSGASGLKIATFEGFMMPQQDASALGEDIGRALGGQWSPFVEARSKSAHEWTVIYIRPIGSRLRLLIATAEKNEFTVLQMDVSGKALEEWVAKPITKTREQEQQDRNASRSGTAVGQ